MEITFVVSSASLGPLFVPKAPCSLQVGSGQLRDLETRSVLGHFDEKEPSSSGDAPHDLSQRTICRWRMRNLSLHRTPWPKCSRAAALPLITETAYGKSGNDRMRFQNARFISVRVVAPEDFMHEAS
ncbi:hypothetical protein PABG_03721 [Paracoccidioides brasiliensis Pb03]|nr:hypothetical protein PABG_03721 [Paracoccidioides brasiliensis Pb03]